MTVLILLLVAFVSLIWAPKPWRRGVSLVLAASIYVASTGMLNGPMESWAQNEQPSAAGEKSGSQLIVLLGLGFEVKDGHPVVPTYALPRILKAVEVYRKCQALEGADCAVLISGGATGEGAQTEAQVYKARLLTSAPDMIGHIQLEEKSHNTWENAQFSSAWAKEHGYSSAVLVTSLLHMPRSQAYFAHFSLPTQAEASEQSLGMKSLLPSAWNLAMVDVFMHEQIGFWRYELYEAMGWNAPSA
ncbi:YdcF family protein [Pseudomonas fluorescens]|uniref:YdcF family protein n=1 Tax=Pseudomonas fluorescens TaxID=294 RepID=UPI001930B48A|nr:YdcF family protein [Pseudomonas fluorescens]MBD8088555.1 YdcF family protein [Pseudomonas fluorescens]